jgi:hypothetical protein
MRDFNSSPSSTAPLLPIGVIVSGHYLLIITALRAGEGSDLPRAEGGDDGGLVPVEDVATLFALLAEGHYSAPLVDYQASLNLYSHVSRPPEGLPSEYRDTPEDFTRIAPAIGDQWTSPRP